MGLGALPIPNFGLSTSFFPPQRGSPALISAALTSHKDLSSPEKCFGPQTPQWLLKYLHSLLEREGGLGKKANQKTQEKGFPEKFSGKFRPQIFIENMRETAPPKLRACLALRTRLST